MTQPEEIRYACIGCGTWNPAGADVCRGCGHRFRETTGLPEAPESRLYDPYEAPRSRIQDDRSKPVPSLIGAFGRVIATISIAGATLVASVVAFVATCVVATSGGAGDSNSAVILGILAVVVVVVGIGFLTHYTFRSPRSH